MLNSKYLQAGVFFALGVAAAGCVKAPSTQNVKPFELTELDACLAIVVDMSGSFASSWSGEAHPLFLGLMDQFFVNSQGGNARVVLCQLSGHEEVVLFEGSPADLRNKFHTPDDLNAFLDEHSDPAGSPVYRATDRAISYVASMPGIGENTQLMTVILSDLKESASYGQPRQAAGIRMLSTLTRYQQMGGGLALYFVAQSEQDRWQKILQAAGFKPGTYVIENTLVAQPQLPQFD